MTSLYGAPTPMQAHSQAQAAATLPAKTGLNAPLDLGSPAANAPVYYMGHLNPDTDSIMSALAAAELFGGIAARSGPINKESQYLLQRFSLPEPTLVTATKGKKFVLLDFNQSTQAPAGLDSDQIVGIIDHHALQGATFEFAYPIDINIKAWGSTCTILTKLYHEAGRTISKSMAQALLGGIISDTLALTSPTTTPADRTAVAELAPLAGVSDIRELAHAMFMAKSDLAAFSADEIISSDFKTFRLAGEPIGFGVAESLDGVSLSKREPELRAAMASYKKKLKLTYLFFAIINPESKASELLLLGPAEQQLAELAFTREASELRLTTTPLVSRKREFIPRLTQALQGLRTGAR